MGWIQSAKQFIRCDIICRLPLGNGHEGNNENRPRESLFQGKNYLSDACLRLARNSISR
ncbi:MAG: hypothetical protein Q8P34_06495 [Bacteroidota bacterium]|nr:hypothetical protein [Bacteroidota bacterium]